MLIALNRKTLEPLLIDVSKTLGVVVSMAPHRMRTTDPFHESAQFTIKQWSQLEVIVIRHQLVA